MNTEEVTAPDPDTDTATLLLTEVRGINDRLARIESSLEQATHRIQSIEELREDLWPMVHGISNVVSRKLHQLDQEGAAGFASESLRVAERIMTSFDEEDVRLLGDNVVGILKTVRNMTQPEVLEIADRAAVALRESDSRPGKRLSLFKAIRDPDVRRGMNIMLTVLRELGTDADNGNTGAPESVAASETSATAVSKTA